MLTIIVEGESDKQIVSYILQAAGFSMNIINVVSMNGKANIVKYVQENNNLNNYIILMDSDKVNIPDSVEEANKYLKLSLVNDNVKVFCAIPQIESWVFADSDLLFKEILKKKKTKNTKSEGTIKRIIMTDEVPYPKQLLNTLFLGQKNKFDYSFLREINIEEACLHSASLKIFLKGVSTMLNHDVNFYNEMPTRNLNRNIFANLIKEVLPSETIVYKTLDGHSISALDMINEIETGSYMGKDYCLELLRISRDLLIRSIKRGGNEV